MTARGGVRARGGILLPFLAIAALILSACGGLPTGGPVNHGLSAVDDDTSDSVSFFLPDPPQPGAEPEQIVAGFIRAGSGPGVRADWARAREFLAPEIRDEWNPEAGVTVDLLAQRRYTVIEEGVVELALAAVATVDDAGAYERAEVPERALSFRLGLVDGEWRITEAPDGIVLGSDEFPTVFHRYPVMYFDPSWTYLVPDVRWFPTTNAASRIVRALVNGEPSEWLVGAVATAFPENVDAVASVPVTSGGLAEVDLSDSAIVADAETRDRMYTQLVSSLSPAGVNRVEMSVGTTSVLDATAVDVRSTRLPGAPLVLTDEGFGFLTGDELEPIAGLSEAIVAASPVAVQTAPDRDYAAVRLASGAVARVGADATTVEVDARADLIDPSIDPFGIVWSVPRDAPAALLAVLPTGDVVEVADAWAGATRILAMSVSRDGTRAAAVVSAGERIGVWVAGIVRGPEQIPLRLGDPIQIGTVSGVPAGITWLDDVTVAVLSNLADDAEVLEQTVGGPASTVAADAGMASIAGGATSTSLRLRAEDGTLYVRRGTALQPTASGVLVLATQQGMPE